MYQADSHACERELRRVRWVSFLSPVRYFIHIGYGVTVKGSSLLFVARDVAGIVVLETELFAFSLWWFKRSVSAYSKAWPGVYTGCSGGGIQIGNFGLR